jgi:hypothetical protein
MSWLDLVPVSTDAYAYQAALLCEDCGRTVADFLKNHGVADDGDSGTFPQGPISDGGGEADAPQFCDRGRDCCNALSMTTHGRKVGCPLGNPLTSDGVLSLVSMIKENLVSRDAHQRLVGRLLARVWSDYARPSECLGPYPPKRGNKLPTSLAEVLTREGLEAARPVALDTESIYLIADKGGAAYLLQSTATDEGEFESVESVTVPVSAAYDPFKLIAEAVVDMVWD